MSNGRTLGAGRMRKTKRGEGGALWVLDWRGADGKRRRQALSSDRRVAERMRAEIVHRRDLELAGLAVVEGQSRRLSEVRTLYLDDLRTRVTDHHFRTVTRNVDRTIKALGDPRVRDLRSQQLLAVRAQRVGAGLANRTVNQEIGDFRAMLVWAARHGVIAQCPIPPLNSLPIDRDHTRRNRRALDAGEVQRLFQAAEADDRAMERRVAAEQSVAGGTKSKAWNARARSERVPQAALVRMFVETGARYGECTRVEWADIDAPRRLLTLRAATTKSGKARIVPLRQALVDELIGLRAIHERVLARPLAGTDRVFLTPEGRPWPADSKNTLRIFNRILMRARIEQRDAQGRIVDLHSLRHTSATLLARGGAPITVTQKILGHASVELTARFYLHLDVDDLRIAVERVHGGAAARARVG